MILYTAYPHPQKEPKVLGKEYVHDEKKNVCTAMKK
jgi:hypothetical protein